MLRFHYFQFRPLSVVCAVIMPAGESRQLLLGIPDETLNSGFGGAVAHILLQLDLQVLNLHQLARHIVKHPNMLVACCDEEGTARVKDHRGNWLRMQLTNSLCAFSCCCREECNASVLCNGNNKTVRRESNQTWLVAVPRIRASHQHLSILTSAEFYSSIKELPAAILAHRCHFPAVCTKGKAVDPTPVTCKVERSSSFFEVSAS